MRAVVVYYSLEGNTDCVARRIADRIGCDLVRLSPSKAYPTGGLTKFVWGGASAVMGKTPPLEPYAFDVDAYDLVILGFPVWASTFAPPLRTFLSQNDLRGRRVAAFACQAGSGGDKALDKLEALAGVGRFEARMVLVDPKDRPTDANDRAVDEFCDALVG